MPCMSYDEDTSYTVSKASLDRDQKALRDAQERNHQLARNLCVAMNALEKAAMALNVNLRDYVANLASDCKSEAEITDLMIWWVDHRRADLEECRKRKARESALAKLSDEEKELLGIDN